MKMPFLRKKKYSVRQIYGKDKNILILLGISITFSVILFLLGLLSFMGIELFDSKIIGALDYIVFGILLVVSGFLFYRSLKETKPQLQVFQPSRVMDFLAFGSIIIFLVLGTFFVSEDVIITSQPLNELAVKIENIWVFLCSIVFFGYRFWKKSDITV